MSPQRPAPGMSGTPGVLSAFAGVPGIRAFFTTRRGGFSEGPYDSLNLGPLTGDDPGAVRRNWAHLLASQGLDDPAPALPRLCHGAELVEAEDSGAWSTGAMADAVYTRRPGRVVAVTAADCLPVLVADPVAGCVAAVHAGWRGTRDGVLERALARLFAEGLCRPADTRIVLGPCLSERALEVGPDVADTLPDAHVRRGDGRAFFDLRGANRAQAIAAGVFPARVEDVAGCTRERPDLFFSHRRARADGSGTTGRMAACIALLPA